MAEKNYLDVANEPGMWVVCSLIIFVVIFQAFVFMKKAYVAGLEMGLSKQQLKSALRSGAITTVGPSFAVVIAMVSLIASLGAPFAWMRLSVIGSVPFEIMAAQTGAAAVGATLGGEGYDLMAFSASVWTCTLGATGWMVICVLFTDKFDVLRKKAVRNNEALLPILSVSAMVGAFAYFGAPYLYGKGMANTVAYLVGAIVMIVINFIANKSKASWLKEWSLGIAMIFGMFVALLFV